MMLLTPMGYPAPPDPFMQNSGANFQLTASSPYEGTPIFLLPSPAKSSNSFRLPTVCYFLHLFF